MENRQNCRKKEETFITFEFKKKMRIECATQNGINLLFLELADRLFLIQIEVMNFGAIFRK